MLQRKSQSAIKMTKKILVAEQVKSIFRKVRRVFRIGRKTLNINNLTLHALWLNRLLNSQKMKLFFATSPLLVFLLLLKT
jgi:hypothetical protein